MIPEYTVASLVGLAVVVVVELRWLRTGLFRDPAYWIAMAINLFFMVLVDGWLTKLSAPIVLYNLDEKTPWRFPWDIPVEDFPFGIALLTLVMLLWDRAGRRQEARQQARREVGREARR